MLWDFGGPGASASLSRSGDSSLPVAEVAGSVVPSRTGDSSFSVAEAAGSVVPCWGHHEVMIHSIDLAS